MKKILKTLGIYLLCFALATLVYILSFYTPLFGSVEIFFYRALLLLVFVCILLAVAMALLARVKKTGLDWKDVLLTVAVTGCVHMAFLATATVSLDRSLSVWMLCYMSDQTQAAGMSYDALDKVFEEEFIEGYGMLGRRLDEQIASGNIEKTDEGYRITPQGQWMVSVFRLVGRVFPVDQKHLYPAQGESG